MQHSGQRVIITGKPNPEAVRILLEAILAWKLQQSESHNDSVAEKDGG